MRGKGKEGGGGKEGERKRRRMPKGKENWRVDNNGQKQQQILGGQKADGMVQESQKPGPDREDSHEKQQTDSHSRTSERLRNCQFRHCKKQE